MTEKYGEESRLYVCGDDKGEEPRKSKEDSTKKETEVQLTLEV